jgi:transcriptional regulator with XRE-family HTH domain
MIPERNYVMPVDVRQIEELRVIHGLSQERAAELCGISGRSGWNNLVNGRVKELKVSQLEKMADVFKVSIDKLLNRV